MRAGGSGMSVHSVSPGREAVHAHRLLRRAPGQCLHPGRRLPAPVQAAAPGGAPHVPEVRTPEGITPS